MHGSFFIIIINLIINGDAAGEKIKYSVDATSSIMKRAIERACELRGRIDRGCPYRHGDGVDGRVGQSLPNGDRV